MKNNKKAFTIVELVIVIAVIAILAAVLIPTFSNLIEQANKSTDEQLCRNYNTILATEKVFDNDISLYEAINAFEANGFNAHNFETNSKTYVFSYDKENAMAVLLNRETGAVEYPATYKSGKLVSAYPKDGKSFIKGVYEYMILTPYAEYNSQMSLESGKDYVIDCNKNVYDMGTNTNSQIKVTNGLLLNGSNDNKLDGDTSIITSNDTNENVVKPTSKENKLVFDYQPEIVDSAYVIKDKVFINDTNTSVSVGIGIDRFTTSDNKIVFQNCKFIGTYFYHYSNQASKSHIVLENNEFINSGTFSVQIQYDNASNDVIEIRNNKFFNSKIGVEYIASGIKNMIIENNEFDLKLESKPKSTNGEYSAAVRIVGDMIEETIQKINVDKIEKHIIRNNDVKNAGSLLMLYHTLDLDEDKVGAFVNKFEFVDNKFSCDKVNGYANTETSNDFASGVKKQLLEAFGPIIK